MKVISRFHYVFWIPAAYFVLYVISHLPLAWGHRLLFPDTPYALLIFLPAGLRLMTTWYFGARAIVPLLVGSLVTLWWYGHPLPNTALAQAMIGATAAFVSFELFRLCGFNLYASAAAQTEQLIQPHWRNLYLVGLFSSMINGLLSGVLFHAHLEAANFVPFVVMYIAGDMIGILV
ncbi:MAG: hypothetical protein VW333_11565, partial [Pseudomonadales bacterium]